MMRLTCSTAAMRMARPAIGQDRDEITLIRTGRIDPANRIDDPPGEPVLLCDRPIGGDSGGDSPSLVGDDRCRELESARPRRGIEEARRLHEQLSEEPDLIGRRRLGRSPRRASVGDDVGIVEPEHPAHLGEPRRGTKRPPQRPHRPVRRLRDHGSEAIQLRVAESTAITLCFEHGPGQYQHFEDRSGALSVRRVQRVFAPRAEIEHVGSQVSRREPGGEI